MKNLFKEIRTRYYEFADWCDESNEVFVNKKNEVVGIVDMYGNHPIKYFFMNLLYKRTNEVDYGKEDYLRLYSPKELGDIQFYEDMDFNKEVDEKDTIGYLIKNRHTFTNDF